MVVARVLSLSFESTYKLEGSVEVEEAGIINYVLNDFTPDEQRVITGAIPRVSEAILYLLTQGLTATMNRYN